MLPLTHRVLLENLQPAKRRGLFHNLGVGKSYSNRETINSVHRVTGKPLQVIEGPSTRRRSPELYHPR